MRRTQHPPVASSPHYSGNTSRAGSSDDASLGEEEEQVLADMMRDNRSVARLTNAKIRETNREILSELGLPRAAVADMMRRLSGYRLIEDASDVRPGMSIKWVPLKTRKLGGASVICRIDETEDGEDTRITYRNFGGRFFSLYTSKAVVFQKLTEQEEIVLYAIDMAASG